MSESRPVVVPQHVRPVGPPSGSVVHTWSGHSMGTVWQVQVAAPQAMLPPSLETDLHRVLDRVIHEMSHWDPNSHLGRFNAAPPNTWQDLPDWLWQVLSYAQHAAQLSHGAFDPAAGSLVNAWGFGPHNRYDQAGHHWPTASELAALCAPTALRPWQTLRLDTSTHRAWQPGGLQLDLGAVAKGFAVDQLSALLLHHGLPHHLVDIGGELKGQGMKPDRHPWWVALEAPTDLLQTPAQQAAMATVMPVVALHDLAVATSGDYRRVLHHGGQRFPHTLDTRTGQPIQNGLASVSVLHPQCMVADAMATAISVMGLDAGLAFADAQQLPTFIVQRAPDHIALHRSAALEALLA